MARDFYINGATLIKVKGAAGTGIANLQELGLPAGPIRVTPNYFHKPITEVDAWGNQAEVETQLMNMAMRVQIDLIHFDADILDICIRESMGGATAEGTLVGAGLRMGNGAARFAATNHYIGLNILSPIRLRPWRFYFTYLENSPEYPLGTEKSIVKTSWVVVPYIADPWNGGVGSQGVVVYDRVLDT